MTETSARAALVAEALSWLGTPFHHQGRIKGAGVDCGMLVAEVYEQAGLTAHVETPEYDLNWNRGGAEEIYLSVVIDRLHEVDSPKPGDVVLFQMGRNFAHGAIVVEWPTIVHASRRGVELGNVEQDGLFAARTRRFFSLWGGK